MVCSRSGSLALENAGDRSLVAVRGDGLQSPQPRSPQRDRDWAVEPARAPFGQEVVEEELRTYMTGCDTALACVRAESEQGTPMPGSGDIHR